MFEASSENGISQFHGGAVFATATGPDGDFNVSVGDVITSIVTLLSFDDFGDSITMTDVQQVVYHKTGTVTNHLAPGTQIIFNRGGLNITNATATLPVTLPGLFDSALVRLLDVAQPEDADLPSGNLLIETVVQGIDNRDGMQPGVPLTFTFSFQTYIHVTRPLLNLPVPYTFTTIGGTPRFGSTDGVGTSAQFDLPTDLVVDPDGTAFVADTGNHTIRMMLPDGEIRTVVGLAGVPGSDDGTNGTSRFFGPSGITLGQPGVLYVADQFNHTIRKIERSGTNWVVTTIAGKARSGGDANGTNTQAQFSYPRAIAHGPSDTLYVADGNTTLRQITTSGSNWVTTTIASLSGYVRGLAVDGFGKVYFPHPQLHTISVISREAGSNWVVSAVAGLQDMRGTSDGTNSSARFNSPTRIAIDNNGNLYVTDTLNNSIRKVQKFGTNSVVTTFAGLTAVAGSDDGTGTNALFNAPEGIGIDSSGNLYVADSQNNAVRQITSAGVVNTVAGSPSGGSANGFGSIAHFNHPQGIAVDNSGNAYVADASNAIIRRVTSAGLVTTLAGLAGNHNCVDGVGNNSRFVAPSAIALDAARNLYITDCNTIRRITPAGVVTTLAGSSAAPPSNADGTNSVARFNSPNGILVGQDGTIYVADSGNHSIRTMTQAETNWVVRTIAGSGSPGAADASGTNASFHYPTGLAMDSSGNLFVADSTNHTIRQLTRAGSNWVVTTIAGSSAFSGKDDGIGSAARFFTPAGMAINHEGTLFVVDNFYNTIKQIRHAGASWIVNTIGGLAGFHGSADGAGSAARFVGPTGIAADESGNIYVADTLNNTIRRGTFTLFGSNSVVPYSKSAMNGSLCVMLVPGEAHGQWRFPWEFGWHNSGYVASNLVAGNYPIEFRSVPGYLAIPLAGPVQVTGGATALVTNEYFPTISAGDTNGGPGSLSVYLGPTPPEGAGWRFLGENGPFLASGFTTNLLPSTYLIEFATASNRVKPPSQSVEIRPGQRSAISVNYLLAATPPTGVELPSPVPLAQVGNETNYPFGFNGQLQTDNGYGSGVAVQSNVVLTAAHLVFNDQTLSFVSRAHWFFRRDSGDSEPLPQAARGWYLFSGYAAQRTNDLSSGYFPNQSSPPSRNLDVAALYFSLPVAGGGYGGYLPSDAVPNSWLTGNALKMLAGYPVDGSQFGDASIVPGKLYQTQPQPYPLSLSADPVPIQQEVYAAPWFLSYPGNSGGPFYVQFNGYYYPAAVYLGTLFSGSQPYASVVRAIDSNVVNLIRLAASQGDSGTNNTGGGIITIIPTQGVTTNAGYVFCSIQPPAALRAGAAWRLSNDAVYASLPNYTRSVKSTNPIVLEYKMIDGWNLPSNQTVMVLPGLATTNIAFYTVTTPLLIQKAVGLGMTGTTGTTYRLERSITLRPNEWFPFKTNTLTSTGFNLVLPPPGTNASPTFYRLLWLPQ